MREKIFILFSLSSFDSLELPIAASRTVALGGTVATVGFPDIGLQGFAPKLAKGEIASLSGAGDDPRYFQMSVVFADGHHAAGQFGVKRRCICGDLRCNVSARLV